jgi:hypothetical protein
VSETLEDRRGVRMTARRENSLWVFRPVVPYDLRGLENDRIHVRHLVVDLVGSPNPVEEWQHSTGRSGRTTHFNYDRTLA